MTITPAGNPAWARTAEIGDFGGSNEKRNYLDRGPIDVLTDISAEQFARLTADLEAAARTVPLLVASIGCDDHTPGPPLFGARLNPLDLSEQIATGCAVASMVGNRLAPYVGDAAPTGCPGGSSNGVGDVTVTLPTTWADPFGVEYPVKICHAFAHLINSGDARAVAVPEIVSDTVVRVRCFNGSNAPLANAIFCLSLY